MLRCGLLPVGSGWWQGGRRALASSPVSPGGARLHLLPARHGGGPLTACVRTTQTPAPRVRPAEPVAELPAPNAPAATPVSSGVASRVTVLAAPVGSPTSTSPLRSAAETPTVAATATVATDLTRNEVAATLPAPAATVDPAAAPPAAPRPPPRTACRIPARRRRQRRERRKVVASLLDRVAEGAAVRAGAQVGLDVAPAHHPSVGVGEPPRHLCAGHLTPLLELAQAQPRLVDRLSRDRGRGVERRADLVEVEAGQLAHHQRRSLALRKLGEVGEQLAQALALGGRLGRSSTRRGKVVRELDRLAAPAQEFDRLVAGDPVEPGLELDLPLLAGQRAQGLDHRVLEGVLASSGLPTIERQKR